MFTLRYILFILYYSYYVSYLILYNFLDRRTVAMCACCTIFQLTETFIIFRKINQQVQSQSGELSVQAFQELHRDLEIQI